MTQHECAMECLERNKHPALLELSSDFFCGNRGNDRNMVRALPYRQLPPFLKSPVARSHHAGGDGMPPSQRNLIRWFNCCATRDPVIFCPNGIATMHSLRYLTTAAAIAVAVWALTGAPLPSHPDSRVAQAVGHR